MIVSEMVKELMGFDDDLEVIIRVLGNEIPVASVNYDADTENQDAVVITLEN